LLVLGTTEFSSAVAGTASASGYRVAGFVENQSHERCRETLDGLPIHWVDDLPELAVSHVGVCGLGTTRRRVFVDQASEHGLAFARVVHPTVSLGLDHELGAGCYVGVRSVVGGRTRLGAHALVLHGSLIGSRVEIGDYASLLTGVNVGSACTIGEAAYVSAGAIVVDGVRIGSGAVVGAGAVVEDNVPDNVQVVGVPARIVKEGVHGR
jgi:sugar O-acyltransferase (sialic acid O-acetyltransferase NeuD family)